MKRNGAYLRENLDSEIFCFSDRQVFKQREKIDMMPEGWTIERAEKLQAEQQAKEQARREAYLASLQIYGMIQRGELITCQEAATLAGSYERQILRWAKQGKFPASIRYGKKHYWNKAEAEQWITCHHARNGA